MQTSFRIDDNLIHMIDMLTDGTETPSQFAKKATKERINRMAARDERATKQNKEKLKADIEPIIIDVLKRQGVIK